MGARGAGRRSEDLPASGAGRYSRVDPGTGALSPDVFEGWVIDPTKYLSNDPGQPLDAGVRMIPA
jgi:hypothetical protein